MTATFQVLTNWRGVHHGRMVVEFTTTYVISVYPTHDKVYSIHLFVLKFVCYLQQVSGFLLHNQNWPKVESGVKHHNPNPNTQTGAFSFPFYNENNTQSNLQWITPWTNWNSIYQYIKESSNLGNLCKFNCINRTWQKLVPKEV
jgi:hypothetical protein